MNIFKWKKYIFLVLCLFLFIPNSIFAETVSLVPVEQEIETTQEFVLDLTIDQVEDLVGVSFDLIFDANSIEYSNLAVGSFMSQACPMAMPMVSEINPGHLVVGIVLLNPMCASVSGSGTLAEISFIAKNPVNETEISFLNQSLARSDMSFIEACWQTAKVTVVEPEAEPEPELEPVIVSLIPAVQEVEQNKEFELSLTVDQVQDFSTVYFDLYFDSDLIEFSQLEAGSFVNQECPGIVPMVSEIAPGNLAVGMACFENVSGSGTLVDILFVANNPVDETEIYFSNQGLLKLDASSIESGWQIARAAIVEPGGLTITTSRPLARRTCMN